MTIPWLILGVYALMSAVTFVLFGLDKRASRRNQWRIRERTLHGLELLGGFPGALAGQRVFRHKSSKRNYRLVLWIIIAIHVCGWCGWEWWIWRNGG